MYEKMLVRQWSEAGLYRWAEANRNATSGVNLIDGSDAVVEGVVPDIYGSIQEFDIIDRNDATGQSSYGGQVLKVDNVPMVLAISRAHASGSVIGQTEFSGGYMTAVADWTEADSLRTQDQDSAGGKVYEWVVERFPRTQAEELTDLPERAVGIVPLRAAQSGIAGWENRNGLRVYLNLRHAKGAPKGWNFAVGSTPVGTGWDIPYSSADLGDKQSYEVLFTTAPDHLATEQVLFGTPYTSGAGWAVRAYINDGKLRVAVRGKNYDVAMLDTSAVYHLVVCHDNRDGRVRIELRGVASGMTTTEDTQAGTGAAATDRIALGINTIKMANPKADTTDYFRGYVYHFRVFNKYLSVDKSAELWNDGRPWDHILPWADTARPAAVVGEAYAYGCCLEFLPHNYELSNDSSYMISSVADRTGRHTRAFPAARAGVYRPVLPSYYDPADATEWPAVPTPYTIRIANVMVHRYQGEVLPYRLSPTEILQDYDPYDTTVEPVEVTLYNGAKGGSIFQTVRIERPAGPQGYADVDISRVLKRAFFEQREEFDDYVTDYLLRGTYDLRVGKTYAASQRYVRQVQQYGCRRDIAADPVAFYVTMPQPIKRYEGYPLEIVAFNPAAGTSPAFVRYHYGSTFGTIRVNDIVGSIRADRLPAALQALSISSSPDHNEPCLLRIENACTPENPFYIRWINWLGGWDYRMFARRQYYEDETNDVANIQLAERDDECHLQETIGLTVRQHVEVGAENIPKEEFHALRLLARSPRVEWWNESVGQWCTIVLGKEAKTKWASDDACGVVKFTFALPRIRVQF